ncbi:MAG: hypothetical protein CK425_07315 [Parachlamydia sp.]|nr:MAG: hypothetical protein CK425_07315 [Parachlamydia sp.]
MNILRPFLLLAFLFVLFSNFSSMDQTNQYIQDSSHSADQNHSPRKFQLAYTTSRDSNEITPVNLQTGMMGTPILFENHPKGLIFHPDAQVIYIFQHRSNEIIPVDLKTGKASSAIILEMVPKSMVISPDGNMAYLIYEDFNQIHTLELSKGTTTLLSVLDDNPRQLLLAPDGKTLYVSYEELHEITSIDIHSCTMHSPISLNELPHFIALAADGRMAYVSENSSKEITFYDLETGALQGLISIESDTNQPQKKIRTLNTSVDGKIAYLTQADSNEMISINLETQAIDTSIITEHKIESMAIYPRQELVAAFSETIASVGEESFFNASISVPLKSLIISYEWDFGDGCRASTTSPYITHTYTSAEHFEVSLTVVESLEGLPLETPDSRPKALQIEAKTTKTIEILKNFDSLKAATPPGPLFLSEDTATTLTSSADPAVFGQSITFTATVASAANSFTPTGSVTFVDAVLGTLGTGILDEDGVAIFSTSTLAVGSYSLSANYSGDANYNASSSAPPPLSQDVNQALTATSVTGTPNPSYFGNPVTFTAIVSVVNPGAGMPSGIVTFYDGAVSIGTAPVIGGQATLISTTLAPGSHSVSAVYGGDTNFLTSTSSLWTQTINKATTSTSVTTSLSPSIFGNSVTFTATIAITNGAGTPTGTVAFTDGATLLGTQPVSSGTATFSTAGLAVGSHNIIATYVGDANFALSVSPGLTQIINQATTTTTVSSSDNPSTYGQSITLTANVLVATGAGMPTGTVTFKDGTTTLGTSTLSAATATLSLFNLSVNTHSITAVYNGNTNFSGSTSAILSQVVGKATPLASVSSSLSPSNYGDLVTFTATVSAPTTLGLPSGSINFFDGATLIGTGALTGTGPNTASATFALSTLNAGTHPITAQYSGDGNFNAVTSPAFSQVVNPVISTHTIVFSNSPNPSEIGQAVILRATVTGSTISPPLPPTGSITFFDGATPLGTVAVSPVPGNPNSSTTTLSTSNLAIGAHVITAQYLGDINYPASPVSAPLTQTVIQASTSSIVTTSGTPSKFGETVTFTVTVNALAPGMGAPSGTVSFYSGATFLGNSGALIPGINSSTATFSTSVLSLGSHFILGIYNGDVNFTSSSAPTITQVVIQDATNTLITSSSSSPPGFNFGDNITFTAAVTAAAPGSGIPTGTVQFFDGAALLGSGTLAGGIATFTTFKLYPTPPLHSITAVYSGDSNFIASTSPIFSQAINSTLPTTTTLTSSRNSSPGGASVTYRATVVAAPGPGMGIPGIPTGTVTFTDTTIGLVIGTGTLDANGVATITESGANLPFVGPAPDIHQILASYNGQTAVFDPSNSALFNQYVVPLDTTTTLVATPDPTKQAGATLVATVNVVGGVPPFPNVGTVTFFEGTTNLGTVPLAPDGTATLMPNDLHFGLDTVMAIYSGDTLSFATSTSNPISLQVQQTAMLTTATTLSSSLANSIYCQPVTFTAVVVATQGFYTPTGTITFFADGVEVGTSILDSTGTAKLTASDLLVGTHAITATYNSDSNYAFSFANTITQTVTANTTATTLTIIPNLASTPYGQNLIFSAIVTSTSPYTAIPKGTVTFSHGTTLLATVPLDNTGEGIYQIASLDVGTYTIVATYNPDPCFRASSAMQSHTITQSVPQTTLTSTPNASTYGDTITLTATVSSSGGFPRGSVTFFNGATVLGTVFFEEGGPATLEIASPPAGFAILSARYNGDTNFLPTHTASILQTINKAPTSTCLVSYTTNPSVYGELVTFQATISSPASEVTPGLTGNVTFKNGAILLGTVPLNGCNSAELEVSSLNLGSGNNIVATYIGDANFGTSASSALTRTVNKASTNTTVTSITSSPNPPTFGTLITVNVAVAPVSPGTGVPTGTITGFYGSTSLGTATLANGIATFTTSTLPAGVQTILVKYSGDTNFTASQITTTETVVAAATNSTITSSANPSVFGQPITFNVVVTSAQGIPTGTVSFLDGTTTLATQTLNTSGTASFTVSSLAVGNHSIRAIYSGSANLASSTTSILNQVVNADSTTTTFTSSQNPSSYGETITLTARVSANSPGGRIPTGTISFKNGAATIGTGTLNSSGQAFLTLSTNLAASTVPYALTAVYSGDTNFLTSTGVMNQTVNKAATITTATYTPNPAPFGDPVTINVKVASINNGTGIPSGIVNAMYGSQLVGNGTLSSDGTVSFATTSLPAGTLGIVVQYLGDGPNGNFLPSIVPLTETVNHATSTTSLTSSANPSSVGQPVTFSVNVNSTAGLLEIPSGIVTFFDGANVIGTQALDTFGNTNLTISNLSQGIHSIKAVYSGDETNNASTSPIVDQVVNPATTFTTLSSILNPSLYGEPITFTAFVGSNFTGSGAPNGTVTFKNGSTILPGGVVTLNSNGEAVYTTDLLPVGGNSITAVYSGSASFTASTSAAFTQTVAKAPTIASVVSANNPATFGSTVPISGSVTALNNGSSLIPAGTTVTAFYGATAVGSGTLNANGQYAFSLNGLPAGTLAIEIKYPGDANFGASTITLTQTVSTDASTIAISSSQNPSNFGQTVTLTNTVTLASGQTPTGTVTYYDGTTAIGTTQVNQALQISTLSPGTHPITAVYSGSASASASNSNLITQIVNQTIPLVSLTTAPNPSVYGNNVTFNATITVSSGGVPTGFVTFLAGTTPLGTGELDSTGHATFATSALAAGSHLITAVYSGDTNFASATSPAATQVVNKVPASGTTTTIVSSVPNPSISGQTVNFFANVVSPNGSPTGTVTFFDGAAQLSPPVQLFDGFAIFPTNTLAAGNHNIRAVYNGDANFMASAPSPIYVQIVQPISITTTTTTTLSSSNPISSYGDPVTFTVQVNSLAAQPPYPSGVVTLFNGGDLLAHLTLNTTGGATYTTSTLPAGNLQIVALYAGDAAFSSSTNVISQVINAIVTTTSLVSTPNPSVHGEAITFTATVSSSGGPPPTGSVSFYNGTTLLQTSLLSNSGVANFVTSNLSTGSHPIKAIYNADPNFATSNANIVQLVNSNTTTTTILSSSPNPSNVGDAVTFIANITAPNDTPTGLVTFYDGAIPIGTTSLIDGLAIFSTTGLSVGSHTITAVYAGDANNNPSTSPPFTQQVINPATILQPPRRFCGCQTSCDFLNKINRVNVLTWDAPGSGAEPEFYKIYRNAQLTDLVATVPACGLLEYKDKNRRKGKIYTYYIVSGNQNGISSPAFVTVDPRKKCRSIGDLANHKTSLIEWHLAEIVD